MKTPSIAIVGAGVAGLACARRLKDAHLSVRLFDKGRSPGGRLATRRVETPLGEARFNHGAQHIAARDRVFAQRIEEAVAAGAAALWTFDDGTASAGAPLQSLQDRWVGTPGMSALARFMAEGLPVETGARVTEVYADGAAWGLEIERANQAPAASEQRFDAVVLALPPAQAAPLLAPLAPGAAAEAGAARLAPCWAGLFVFDRPFDAPFEARRFGADQALSWVARETGKPGRTGPEAWLVHASPEWSRDNLEEAPDMAAAALLDMFRALVPAAPLPIWRQAHRWRYALVETPALSPFSWDPTLRIGVCGDWRLGARVEAAWLSGDGLGAHMCSALAEKLPPGTPV